MSDDQSPPTHSSLVTDLKVLRRTGRGRLRNRDLPALERAARLDASDLQELGIAIDNLVGRAIANLGDGPLGQAAKLLFGYTQGKRGVAVSELRREAAQEAYAKLGDEPYDHVAGLRGRQFLIMFPRGFA